MTIKEQSDSFQAYVERRIREEGEDNLSLDQLYEEWRIENPPSNEHAENVAAVRASLRDMEQGDTGRPAAERIQEMRDKHGLHREE